MSQENITEVGYLGDHVGSSVTILGWVESTRSHGKVGFVVIRDGTGLVQGVLLKKELPADAWALLESLTYESSVALNGEVREEPRAPGGYEVGVTGLELLGASEEYPIQPKEHGVEFLLDHRHLWLRSSLQRAGLRVRHEVEQAIHDYFYERDFVRIDTPILTGSIGESAGTLFEADYFGETAFLAQTGQLYVETACPAFRKVYCFGPTFRAEKSKTRRHLTEFWMLEPEVAFADSDDNMDLQEDLVCYLVERVLERCSRELTVLERDTSELETRARPFERISYTSAVALLQEKGSEIEWGRDLGASDEMLLSEQFDRPVFVHDYPKAVKAFYMKENPEDPRTVRCNDLLVRGYGELIGGSQREDDLAKLLERIREEKLPE
ncbi:MAG: asparagine--tRNA ligase, partial [Gemmatimonadota bacterium]|nr:asparagine--tRNA ligase [Gemmatimonadota bacterium]